MLFQYLFAAPAVLAPSIYISIEQEVIVDPRKKLGLPHTPTKRFALSHKVSADFIADSLTTCRKTPPVKPLSGMGWGDERFKIVFTSEDIFW